MTRKTLYYKSQTNELKIPTKASMTKKIQVTAFSRFFSVSLQININNRKLCKKQDKTA